jgi:hypothetical protein
MYMQPARSVIEPLIFSMRMMPMNWLMDMIVQKKWGKGNGYSKGTTSGECSIIP